MSARVIVCCVSVCVLEAALEKALSCVALEVPSGAGRPAGPQTPCLAPVPPQGLAIVLPLTPFVLFALPAPPPAPPPSAPVFCPAGAADLRPRERGSGGLETMADLSSYLYISILCIIFAFGCLFWGLWLQFRQFFERSGV